MKSLLLLWCKCIDNCRERQIYSVACGKTVGNVLLQRKCLFGEIFLAPGSNICVDTTVYSLEIGEFYLLNGS